MRQFDRKLSFALAALALSCASFVPLQAQANAQISTKKKKSQPSALAELERLDSAANLLLFTSDSARQGQCHIQPLEAQKLLMVIHPMIDESRKKAAAAAINPKWEKTCSKSCHCGLYASILEEKSNSNLTDKERQMMYQLYKKAQQMTSREVGACVSRDAAWFCKSDLLKKLRKDASDFPAPAHKFDPTSAHHG